VKRVFLVLIFLLLGGCQRKEQIVDEGQKFASLEGLRDFSLAEVPSGVHRLIINFYAPDCPPCEKEIPALKKFNAFAQKNNSMGFVAIGSSLKAIDSGVASGSDPPGEVETRRELLSFAKKFSLNYPQHIATPLALKSWRITGFPETFIFERYDGHLNLSRKIISEVSYETLVSINGTGS